MSPSHILWGQESSMVVVVTSSLSGEHLLPSPSEHWGIRDTELDLLMPGVKRKFRQHHTMIPLAQINLT